MRAEQDETREYTDPDSEPEPETEKPERPHVSEAKEDARTMAELSNGERSKYWLLITDPLGLQALLDFLSASQNHVKKVSNLIDWASESLISRWNEDPRVKLNVEAMKFFEELAELSFLFYGNWDSDPMGHRVSRGTQAKISGFLDEVWNLFEAQTKGLGDQRGLLHASNYDQLFLPLWFGLPLLSVENLPCNSEHEYINEADTLIDIESGEETGSCKPRRCQWILKAELHIVLLSTIFTIAYSAVTDDAQTACTTAAFILTRGALGLVAIRKLGKRRDDAGGKINLE